MDMTTTSKNSDTSNTSNRFQEPFRNWMIWWFSILHLSSLPRSNSQRNFHREGRQKPWKTAVYLAVRKKDVTGWNDSSLWWKYPRADVRFCLCCCIQSHDYSSNVRLAAVPIQKHQASVDLSHRSPPQDDSFQWTLAKKWEKEMLSADPSGSFCPNLSTSDCLPGSHPKSQQAACYPQEMGVSWNVGTPKSS